MGSRFIPSFHLIPSSEKLNSQWCKKAIDFYWYNTNNKSLLHGKDIKRIEEYASGDIDMRQFKAMYKSMKKKMLEKEQNHNALQYFQQHEPEIDEIVFLPFTLIKNKIDAAVAILQKVPEEITCTATDAEAMRKKKEDITFLKNKPKYESVLNQVAAEIGISNVDLGNTQHSYTKFSSNPLGLDLENPEEEKIFSDLLYSLDVEIAMEDVLQQFFDFKNVKQVKLLEIKDQYKYAVSCHRAFTSSITGLPDMEYIWPGDMRVPYSNLPDHSDNQARFQDVDMTVDQMFNMFGSEIGDRSKLEFIINNSGGGVPGYCKKNGIRSIDANNFGTAKVRFKYCEIKSIDYVNIYKNPKSTKGFATFTSDDSKATEKIWGQNTYGFWWLENTDYFFQIKVLDYAYRTKGLESYQSFSTNIYKSNEKSAVELSIPQNVIAQIAAIKMAFAVVMAKPDGQYIDIRPLRNAAESLSDENNRFSLFDLVSMAVEKNYFLGDTEGFEGKNDGQFKPIIPIPGGVNNIKSYWEVIQAADQKINQFMGTNDSLTGQSANPDALIGVEKLRIGQSINGLHYVTDAIETQHQKLLNIWSNDVQYCIAAGGKTKEAMINYIGSDDVDLIAGLNKTPIHNLTLKYSLKQREEERARYQQQLNFLKSQKIITTTDEYLLSAISNPKKRFGQLAVIENRFRKREDQKRMEDYANEQRLREQANEGLVIAEQTATDGDIKKIYATADAESKLLQLKGALGMQSSQFDFIKKKNLQQDRAQSQLEKSLKTAAQKTASTNQAPLPIS